MSGLPDAGVQAPGAGEVMKTYVYVVSEGEDYCYDAVAGVYRNRDDAIRFANTLQPVWWDGKGLGAPFPGWKERGDNERTVFGCGGYHVEILRQELE